MPNVAGRILLAFLCLALGARNAVAQTANRWLLLDNGDPTLALDTTTLTRSQDGFPRAWLRMTYKSPQGTEDKKYTSTMVRSDFNCRKRQFNAVETIQYAPNGDVVLDSKQPFPQWTEVVPESTGESVLNAFCKTPFARL